MTASQLPLQQQLLQTSIRSDCYTPIPTGPRKDLNSRSLAGLEAGGPPGRLAYVYIGPTPPPERGSGASSTNTNGVFSLQIDGTDSMSGARSRRIATIQMVLVALVLISFLCNFDHGVIPAILSEIQKNFHNKIKFVEQSLFGSLVYFGLIIGTLFAGIALQSKGAKWLLVISLLCLSSFLFLFSYSNSLLVMYCTRFLTGLCQAVPVVYLPVWVDDYAPEGKVTRWMSYTQLAGIGGTVSGYFLGGVLSRVTTANAETNSGWRTPFFIQSVALIPVVLLLAALPANLVNLPTSSSYPRTERQRTGLSAIGESDVDGSTSSCLEHLSTAFVEVKSLLANPLYVVITLGMSALYFVVTGIQFWVTEFLVTALHFNKLSVVGLSTFCFLTAPTSGVWFGGYVCDLCGGYRGGGQQRTAVRVATLFAGIGAAFAVTSVHVQNFIVFALLLWGCLFCGAALVPVAVGVQLASVPFHQRSISSALSQVAYNLFGWFSAPLVSGVVMDFIDWWHPQDGKELSLACGFEMILWVSVVGFCFFLVANLLTFPSEKIEREELELQLARTRMPTLSF